MRIGLSFSLDSQKDADLVRWLASQDNRSEVVRQALYAAMGAVDSHSDSTSVLLAATRRIEAELAEMKANIVASAPALLSAGKNLKSATDSFAREMGKIGTETLKGINRTSDDADVESALSNLSKLKR